MARLEHPCLVQLLGIMIAPLRMVKQNVLVVIVCLLFGAGVGTLLARRLAVADHSKKDANRSKTAIEVWFVFFFFSFLKNLIAFSQRWILLVEWNFCTV
jgi:hypothetical protein